MNALDFSMRSKTDDMRHIKLQYNISYNYISVMSTISVVSHKLDLVETLICSVAQKAVFASKLIENFSFICVLNVKLLRVHDVSAMRNDRKRVLYA